MMPQKEISEAIYRQADPAYGKYEGTQTSSEREVREGPSGKAYPLPRDKTNILRFALAVIALGLILLFGLLFVVIIGGSTGWASFAVACFAIMMIAGIGMDKIH
jgi:hypothetical protein